MKPVPYLRTNLTIQISSEGIAMTKILALLREYPRYSQTYTETELRYLRTRGHAVKVVSQKLPEFGGRTPEHQDYVYLDPRDTVGLTRLLDEFAPEVVHGHYVHHAPELFEVARRLDIPFTVRGHSYDILGHHQDELPSLAPMINSSLCRGILTFPFTRSILEAGGIASDKIVECWPVVDYARFHDESDNGDAVINMGAAKPKKNFEAYLELAARDRSGRTYSLYPLGEVTYPSAEIRRLNGELGEPVQVHQPVRHSAMRAIYKRHGWLVYTAKTKPRATLGWPMAVAEAQAAGVGVCVQNARPDLAEFVGPGELFDDLDQAGEIIAQPPSAESRKRGFEHARRSDVAEQMLVIERLWAS